MQSSLANGSLSPSRGSLAAGVTSCLVPGFWLIREKGHSTPSVERISNVGAGGRVFSFAAHKHHRQFIKHTWSGCKTTLCTRTSFSWLDGVRAYISGSPFGWCNRCRLRQEVCHRCSGWREARLGSRPPVPKVPSWSVWECEIWAWIT